MKVILDQLVNFDPKDIKSLSAVDGQDSLGSQELSTYSEEGIEQLCRLMGDDIAYRKEFIMNNIDFSKYGGVS